MVNDQSNGCAYNEWGHLLRFKPWPPDRASVKAAFPSYSVLVKMKCLLAWKKGLDLRENKKKKKSQLPDVQDDLCSPALCEHWALRVPRSLKAGAGGGQPANVTETPCCSCWEVEHFSSVPKKMSLYRTLMVLLVGHVFCIQANKSHSIIFFPLKESWHDLVP